MRQTSSCTIFSRKGAHQFVRRPRQIDLCSETHKITRVLETIAKREIPNIPRAPPVPSQGGPQGRSPDTSSYSTVPVVKRGSTKVGLAPTAKVYAGRWALSTSEVPVDSPSKG